MNATVIVSVVLFIAIGAFLPGMVIKGLQKAATKFSKKAKPV